MSSHWIFRRRVGCKQMTHSFYKTEIFLQLIWFKLNRKILINHAIMLIFPPSIYQLNATNHYHLKIYVNRTVNRLHYFDIYLLRRLSSLQSRFQSSFSVSYSLFAFSTFHDHLYVTPSVTLNFIFIHRLIDQLKS